MLIYIEFRCVDLSGRIMRLKLVFNISTVKIVLKYPFVLLSFWGSGFYIRVDLTSMTYDFRQTGVGLREEL